MAKIVDKNYKKCKNVVLQLMWNKKYIEFTIAPIMPIIFSKMIFESKMKKKMK